MKILTLNTHSLIEKDYEKKLDIFVQAIAVEKPDIMCLQEVNQSLSNNFEITPDNHALAVAKKLKEKGVLYDWVWKSIKQGYGKYDEGISVFSLYPIKETDFICISKNDDYTNWRTRKVLGVKVNDIWIYSIHMGWWNDEEDTFLEQWERLNSHLKGKKKVIIAGDFNSPSQVRNEGYDLVKSSGWTDTYTVADEKDDGITVVGSIDGWNNAKSAMRIDQIWSNFPVKVKKSNVIFNESNYGIVSDHFGVMTEIEI